MAYVAVFIFVGLFATMSARDVFPKFFTNSGATWIDQSVLGVSITFFALSFLIYIRQFAKLKSEVSYWYSLALALFAVGLFGVALQPQFSDSLSWMGRIAQYIGGVYFMIALLRLQTGSDENVSLPTKWAEAFRSDRRQVEALFSNMLDGFAYRRIIVDESGKPVDYVYLEINDAFEKMTGQKRASVIGKRGTQFLSEGDKDLSHWIEVFGRVALTGEPVQLEDYSKVLNKWYYVSLYSSKKGYFATILEDITERKKFEDALRKSEEEYRSLFTNMIDGFAYCKMVFDENNKSIDFVYLQINDAFERIIGLKRETIIGNKVTEAIPGIEKANPELFDIYGRVALTCKREKFEIFFKPLSLWLSVSVYCPMKGYFATIFEDITERKKSEEAVARQAELIDLSPDAIIVRKLDGTITFWSKGAEKLYGLSKDEAMGQDINSLLKTEFPQPLEEILNKLKLDGAWSGEIVHTCKDGSKVVVQSYWLPKFGVEGKVVEMLESNVDITERIRMQAQLEESAVRVEEYANQMEDLANQRAEQLKNAERLAAIGATAGMVGHDIRNPLQAITGDIYLAKTELASTPESEEKKNVLESLQEIEKNIDYINKIVADLQDFARPLKPHAEESDIKLIINELLKKNGLPENVKVSIKVENDARKIVSDSTFINRIMYNLVNNAVQAMPKGGKLTIHTYKEANNTVISVKDTGVGIPDSVKGKLFTPMFTTKSKGQGFGLAVIKRMTEALGGTVSFESEVGKGTTFIVRLPPLAKS